MRGQEFLDEINNEDKISDIHELGLRSLETSQLLTAVPCHFTGLFGTHATPLESYQLLSDDTTNTMLLTEQELWNDDIF